ncbi:hypothetical protein PR202_gb15096 [Eleusine coracana subsp. coracana]|uniref:aspartate--tRNA ligase n=1 Tax=Eleusine coracana subsp. coracana TaxID=191504 RepID=A0AAV5EYI6_ELECO|nr:hypothetical protein PR202_gb15096 [Eleusine coracana subsp. coracana]
MSMGLHETKPASAAGVSKKHTRSRGRAKKPVDPYASVYGIVPFNKFRGRPWIDVHELNESMVGKHVLVFGTVRYIRPQSKTRAILVLLDFSSTVPCVIDASADEGITMRMVGFAVTLRHDTPIDVEGVVVLQKSPIATTQKVEILVSKLHSIAFGTMASRDRTCRSSSTGITPRPASAAGCNLPCIYQDPSLNHGSTSIKLCSLVHHAIFRIQSEVEFYLERTLMLKHEDGIQMLKDFCYQELNMDSFFPGQEAGMKVKPMCDLTTEHEKKLGLLVREKYNTDLFILYQHPLALRPLYTMSCVENPAYGNSFDVFIRGEQVISGSQRIHNHEVLMKLAAEFSIDTNHVTKYLDLFRFVWYGLPPHGGFGACLYRVVMLFCGLDHF